MLTKVNSLIRTAPDLARRAASLPESSFNLGSTEDKLDVWDSAPELGKERISWNWHPSISRWRDVHSEGGTRRRFCCRTA
ncbi:hypothetical protein ASPTUDRAFT_440934 [Aspergillus tubingensis CBS 134.48]|uniref:Uncharacterized protein n=1 Tax=Aspergillus tubingensis (strain CBS 134.48) TaxID=767770 RepID=A0A1L9N9J0_ASPTC|nr:hypothetical protein ASPTUDRAFT_440934 [Aspergillus tubingensis CBS 134.48]